MDSGIWATWYDLPDEGRKDYLTWLHETELPGLLRRPGYAWAAHYEMTGGGAKMDEIGSRLARPDEPGLGNGTQFLILVGAASPHVFLRPRMDQYEAKPDALSREFRGLRLGERTCIFTTEARVTGPDFGEKDAGGTPAPGIQMGSFRTRTLEDEIDLGAWYAQYRLPAMSRMQGCVETRKLVSVYGWAKHSILYEFTSLDARHDHFQNHESLALEDGQWTNRVITYTVHAPGSPSVGRRIWPAVDASQDL